MSRDGLSDLGADHRSSIYDIVYRQDSVRASYVGKENQQDVTGIIDSLFNHASRWPLDICRF